MDSIANALVLDAAIVIIILISALISLFRGFVHEFFSLASWICALIGATVWTAAFSERLSSWIGHEDLRMILAFGLLFVAILAVGLIVTVLLTKAAKRLPTALVDRHLGWLFGVVRGVFILTVAVFIAERTVISSQSWWSQSYLIPYLGELGDYMATLLPEELEEKIPEKLTSESKGSDRGKGTSAMPEWMSEPKIKLIL